MGVKGNVCPPCREANRGTAGGRSFRLPGRGGAWGFLCACGNPEPSGAASKCKTPRQVRGPRVANEKPGLPGKTSTVHTGPPRAECMKLVICLPSGHVTVVKWIAEGRKAFDTSLRSVKTLTRVPGAGGRGPCRLLGAPTPGKARLGRGRAAERCLAPGGGSSSSRAPSPQPRGLPPGQRAGEASASWGGPHIWSWGPRSDPHPAAPALT